jgi:futalosine hydrolase
MRSILIVAATEAEINPLLAWLRPYRNERGVYLLQNAELTVLVTGAGMVATTFFCTRELSVRKFDAAINAGIAGAFDRSIALGEVVNVAEDSFSETGAQDGEKFLTLSEIGLRDKNDFPFSEDFLIPLAPESIDVSELKKVKGITVNTVHGETAAIEKIRARLNPQVESMEGAAFFYCCMMEKIPCLQIRAISNYVEKRNREAWKIGEAVAALNNLLVRIMKSL